LARLATRSWGGPGQEPGAPLPGVEGSLQPDPRPPGPPDETGGTRDPDPRPPEPLNAPEGARDPDPRLQGPPDREGSGAGGRGRAGVHSPLGPRPLALLVHGVTSSSRTWWRAGPALAERGFRVVAVDLRGHGGSLRAVAGLSVADLAGDVAETVEGPVELLVGHSLGALVALELVGARPGFARRLVLEDPPGWGSVDWAGLAAGVEFDTRRAATGPDGLRRELAAANPAWPPGEAERRVADLADCDGPAVAAALRGGVAFDLPALLAAARLPTLLLLAEEALGSNLCGLDRKAAVEALTGTTRVLPAGHSLHREALDAWLAAVDAWLGVQS
jgi:pimeloyl-ACP methyl ester carboxylesterase